MDRAQIAKYLEDAEVIHENYSNLYKKWLKDGNINIIILIEELSELQKELTKFLRNKGDNIGIIEEIADVEMMLDVVKLMFNIDADSVDKVKNFKYYKSLMPVREEL